MSTVQEIEQAIEKLSESGIAEIRGWLLDRDIDADVAAGRLDSIAEESLAEHRAGKRKVL
jgi:hypothetical protein